MNTISLKHEEIPSRSFGVFWVLAVCVLIFSTHHCYGQNLGADEEIWETVGKRAAKESISLISKSANKSPQKQDLIVLTNGGYAEVKGGSTQGVLDGLSAVTGASRGRNTLVEIHSAPWIPLWFAVCDKASGNCAYLQLNPSAMDNTPNPAEMPASALFSMRAVEKVDAKHLYEHADECKEKFGQKMFGGNEFRIVTIANAIAQGASTCVVRAFEFHDHFCPGVTSGILMANYLKRDFTPLSGGSYFVHTVDPWCKEDALLVLLNATPGKRAYAVSFPSKADKERRIPEARDAATIVYRENREKKIWEGQVLAFLWPETGCPKTENPFIDKLCADLWYLKHLDKPEKFVKVVKAFELPEGVSPRDWARPGMDPLKELGLLQN